MDLPKFPLHALYNQQKPLVDPTGSRRFVCVAIENGKNIDFEDNLDHQQLFAQALHLFNSGERFWLNNEEIATLIKENEPYQKLNDLVEDLLPETRSRPQRPKLRLRDGSQDVRTYLQTDRAIK